MCAIAVVLAAMIVTSVFFSAPPVIVMGRALGVVLVAAAVLVVAAAAAGRGATVRQGRANAEILWDLYGVPHIYADNREVLVRLFFFPRTRPPHR
jgi:acyl-homoserine lactone acylase PvdQ